MIVRVGTIPSKLHPGAGQSCLALHQSIKNDYTFAIRKNLDSFEYVDNRISEICFENPIRIPNAYFKNIGVYFKRIIQILKITIQICLKTNKIKPEIIHIHSPMYFLCGLFLKTRFGTKMILTIHGSEVIFLKKNSFISAKILRVFDCILFVAKNDQEEFQRLFRLESQKLFFVGNGFAQDKFNFSNRVFLSQSVNILIVGSLRWQKTKLLR